MKKLIVLLSFYALMSCTNDTLVNGFVYTTENTPIAGVKVIVNISDIYTLTDKDGYFEIDTNGISNELLFSKEGYQLKFVKIDVLQKEDVVILAKTPVMLNTSE